MLSAILLVLDTDEKRSKFEYIYEEYHQRMFSIAFGITKDKNDAEDALSSALFIIAEHIDDVKTDNPQMLKSYLYKIVKNAAIKIMIKKQNEPLLLDLDNFPYLSTEESEDNIVGNCQYNELVQVIINMPYTYRDVLVLYYLHGFSVAEISDILTRKKSTVKTQLKRGTQLIKDVLEKGEEA